MNLKHLSLIAAAAFLFAACEKKVETTKTTTTAPAPGTTTQQTTTTTTTTTGGTIMVGTAVGPDKRISAPKESFGKNDTMYVAVDTTATGTLNMKAKWTYMKDGQSTVVKEESQTVAATGPTTSEFHISKPDGWPAGDYQVEVWVNDQPAGTKRFVVL